MNCHRELPQPGWSANCAHHPARSIRLPTCPPGPLYFPCPPPPRFILFFIFQITLVTCPVHPPAGSCLGQSQEGASDPTLP